MDGLTDFHSGRRMDVLLFVGLPFREANGRPTIVGLPFREANGRPTIVGLPFREGSDS